MKLLITIISMFTFLFSQVDDYEIPEEFNKMQYESGENIFDNKCSSCHVKYMEINKTVQNFFRNENSLNLKAPTANQISYRLKLRIGSKEDIEFHLHETNDFLQSFLMNPDRSKTICLEQVIRYFDTMPSLKGVVNQKEIEDLNHFIYFLEGFNGINEFFHDETIF